MSSEQFYRKMFLKGVVRAVLVNELGTAQAVAEVATPQPAPSITRISPDYVSAVLLGGDDRRVDGVRHLFSNVVAGTAKCRQLI
jgi:hypothetical protein